MYEREKLGCILKEEHVSSSSLLMCGWKIEIEIVREREREIVMIVINDDSDNDGDGGRGLS